MIVKIESEPLSYETPLEEWIYTQPFFRHWTARDIYILHMQWVLRSIFISWSHIVLSPGWCRLALSSIITKQRSVLRVSSECGRKIHEFAITIPVVLPDKDYPPATRRDVRNQNFSKLEKQTVIRHAISIFIKWYIYMRDSNRMTHDYQNFVVKITSLNCQSVEYLSQDPD